MSMPCSMCSNSVSRVSGKQGVFFTMFPFNLIDLIIWMMMLMMMMMHRCSHHYVWCVHTACLLAGLLACNYTSRWHICDAFVQWRLLLSLCIDSCSSSNHLVLLTACVRYGTITDQIIIIIIMNWVYACNKIVRVCVLRTQFEFDISVHPILSFQFPHSSFLIVFFSLLASLSLLLLLLLHNFWTG